jgi:CUB domain
MASTFISASVRKVAHFADLPKMKLLLVTCLVLNLAVGGWAVPIEDPVVEEAELSSKDLLDKGTAIEDMSLRSACNVTYTTSSGIISTPNFPGDYTNDLNCYWLIITSTGTRIQLSFDTFVVENGNDILAVQNFDFHIFRIISRYRFQSVASMICNKINPDLEGVRWAICGLTTSWQFHRLLSSTEFDFQWKYAVLVLHV